MLLYCTAVMPHISPETDDGPTDYSSWEYQHVEFAHEESADSGGSARSTFDIGVEPLQEQGGLDQNEVAELIAIRVETDVQTDDHETLSVTEEGVIEYRGVLGANLDSPSDLISSPPNAIDRKSIDQALSTDDGADGQVRTFGHDKSEVFYHFARAVNVPFSSDAGGVGGSGGFNHNTETVNFRELLGRGPVLDASDNVSVVSRLILNNSLADAEAKLRVTMYWDVATVDDAGAKFSVPS